MEAAETWDLTTVPVVDVPLMQLLISYQVRDHIIDAKPKRGDAKWDEYVKWVVRSKEIKQVWDDLHAPLYPPTPELIDLTQDLEDETREPDTFLESRTPEGCAASSTQF